MIVLAVLFILVTALFFFFRGSGSNQIAPGSQQAYRPTIPENAPPAAAVDLNLLAAVQEHTESDRIAVENDALLHLLIESGKTVPGDFRRLGSQPIDSDLYQKILDDPVAYRGQPFYAKALYFGAERATANLSQDQDSEGFPYFRGLAQDDQGQSFSFSVLEEPDNIEEGAVIKIEGFFLKKAAVFGKSGSLVDPTVHLVGKRLVPSYFRLDPVQRLDPAVLETVRDYELQDQANIPEVPLYHCLSFLQGVDADELARAANDRTSAILRRDPDRHRGEFVRVLGTFHDMWPRQLGENGENPLEAEQIWHGLLVHAGPRFTYLMSLDREPPWVRDNPNTIVEGIFLKRYTYVAQNGEAVPCPLILVKRFVPMVVDNSSYRNATAYGVLGLGVILLGWFLMSALGDRGDTREFRRRYYAQRKARVQRLSKAQNTSPEPNNDD